MILICYDGSDDAKAAIERAAELLGDEPATVLTVWEPLRVTLARSPTGFWAIAAMTNMEDSDAASREAAERCAAEGAELARAAGLDATARTCSQETTTANAILDQAEAIGVSAVVMGSRGLTGVKSMLLGSVSHAIVNHSDRMVILVPSPAVATSRVQARHAIHGLV